MLGYHYVMNMRLIDALYATVTTLVPVSARPSSAPGKIFTMILAIGGYFIIFAIVFGNVSNAIEVATSEQMQHMLRRRKLDKTIRSMQNHYIICGYGRMGQAIAGEFRARKVPFVVVEDNEEQMPRLIEEKALFVEGDASDEKILTQAGVVRAQGLISVAPTDADNTFIVLTAKGMNPNLFVVARSIKVEDEPKLRRAGADRVISPYILGGKRMAWAMLRPNVVDFLDSTFFSEEIELEIEELEITADSKFVDTKIRDAEIRILSGATVVAIKNRDGVLTSSPSPDLELQEGDILIAVGTRDQLSLLKKMAEM
jgi:voltage-gated potassium channel